MNDRIQELESELRFYRDLFSACRVLDAAAAVTDAIEDVESDEAAAAWNTYEIALHEVREFVWTVDHADQMDAAGVTCNELHHATITPTA